MRDFTLSIYIKLLKTMQDAGYTAQTFQDFLHNPHPKAVILRLDVDRTPKNALAFARVESEMGLLATYYFRIVPVTFKPDIIKEIAALGHEIGYHYEGMDLFHGDIERAHKSFTQNLIRLRELVSVNTICMHGSPLSKWDNKVIWKYFNYHDLNIVGEPYFDVDYHKVFYLSDTGRKWNNVGASIRDKVDTGFDINVDSTFHMIDLFKEGMLPDQIMINSHPHRWHNGYLRWFGEFTQQGIKNIVKRHIIRING